MKTKRMMVMGLAALCAMALAGEASARGGKGNGGANGQKTAARNCTQTQTGNAGATTRPAGSQRRDGTFLTTGTTANGATTRPSNGKGLQDGSRLAATPVEPAAAAQ